jgi:GH24 family phage-related lysozyme (muramidase)
MEVAAHEGMVRQAYRDSTDVWTFSVGITSKSGHQVERYIGRPQPLAYCLDVWLTVLEHYAEDVRKAMAGRPLTEAQFAAALSFHWNTGAIHRAGWVKHWKAGNDAKARKAIMDWRKPAEITPRRQAERDLFFSGKWSGDGRMTEYTRLDSRHRPIWGSAVKVDVGSAIADLLGGATGHMPSQPKPDVEPPEARPERPTAGIIAALVAGAAALCAAAWGWASSLFGG